ncbi:MAG: 2-C-methyl-D-erythritol 2,4-cyclodiphosphate synthase [Acidaminococcales bacterium]|jgi:2-C-methyl-D-erythritol 2,4-cyclodiphosphate synthase|nr:2-C-methyl-D-erythritol 2,4-cyclodiphosphate synthase [Acidaminococcales bacterium]
MDFHVGNGFDVHALSPGRRLVIGGVAIPYEYGLLGHSDADALIHSIADALLGAAGLGDIGRHFPDTDPRYKDVSSLALLAEVMELLRADGWRVNNIDAVVMAQAPKLEPYIEKMRKNIAQICRVDGRSVNVKATTTERLGFVGRGEGIAAEAVASIVKSL